MIGTFKMKFYYVPSGLYRWLRSVTGSYRLNGDSWAIPPVGSCTPPRRYQLQLTLFLEFVNEFSGRNGGIVGMDDEDLAADQFHHPLFLAKMGGLIRNG